MPNTAGQQTSLHHVDNVSHVGHVSHADDMIMQEPSTESSPRRHSHGDLGQLPLPRLHHELGAACASGQHLSILGWGHGR